MRSLPSDARARAGLIGSAAKVYEAISTRGDASPARLLDDVRRLAHRDESYGVRAEALRVLGKIGGAAGRPVIIESLSVPSQHDQIRRAALAALADLDDAEGLDLALRYAAPGIPARTRPEAIEAVTRLAHHNREVAINTLVSLLNDREARTARAAGDALARLGGPAATQAIEDFAARAQGAIAKSVAEDWMKRVKESRDQAAGE
jgi:HEAT repeat protein